MTSLIAAFHSGVCGLMALFELGVGFGGGLVEAEFDDG